MVKNKMVKNKIKKKVGRPLFDGKPEKDVIQKLEMVWSIGGSDKEASFFADISPAALSDYLKKHPEISERKNALLQKPILKARQEVIKGLDNNPEFALKYLERKLPDEFSIRTKTTISGDASNPLSINLSDISISDLIALAKLGDNNDEVKS